MRFITALRTIALLAASTTVKAWNRLDKENAAVLVIDYQVGLAQLVRDFNTNDFRNNMLAHAALGNLFELPVVMTTSSDAGPNGLMIKEVVDLNPNVTIVHRQGEVNAWDNAEFRAAVKASLYLYAEPADSHREKSKVAVCTLGIGDLTEHLLGLGLTTP